MYEPGPLTDAPRDPPNGTRRGPRHLSSDPLGRRQASDRGSRRPLSAGRPGVTPRRSGDAAIANARLTGTTGVLLLVMLAAEGLTIASIRHLLAWHIAIGVALIPPVALKMGSTLWRFARYYLGDAGYRRAGPPIPVLRALGPVLFVATAALLATGVAAWLSGPRDGTLVSIHRDVFFLWFAAMTVHVLAHVRRATRLAGADLGTRGRRTRVPYRRTRQWAVLASVAVGVALGFVTTGISSGWTSLVQRAH